MQPNIRPQATDSRGSRPSKGSATCRGPPRVGGPGRGGRGNWGGDWRGAQTRDRALCLDIPASAWGGIIGKGGETLRALQGEFGVSIQVPRPDAPAEARVKLRGPSEACEACRKHIEGLVEKMGRKSKKAGAGSSQKPTPGRPFPAQCLCCGTGINGLVNAFSHLGSARHLSTIQEHLSIHSAVPQPSQDPMTTVALFEDSEARALHAELVFDVDALVEAAAHTKMLLARSDVLTEEASRLAPDFDWLDVEARWFSAWNSSPTPGAGSMPLEEAPPLSQMLERCLAGEKPPMVRMPGLPASLPRVHAKSAKLRWPSDPTSRLGIAVLLKNGLAVTDVDVICGTSFMHALSGNAKYTKDVFYLQRYRGTLCCLHIPSSKTWSRATAGHSVEFLLCGMVGGGHLQFYASSQVRVGQRSVLITSEVDARDKSGQLVEIKSSINEITAKELGEKAVLQVACNGSASVLCCRLDADETRLLSAETVGTAEVLERHRESFIYKGQRIRLLLDRLFAHPLLEEEGLGRVGKLTFDQAKVPQLEPAPPEVRVLPSGFPMER